MTRKRDSKRHAPFWVGCLAAALTFLQANPVAYADDIAPSASDELQVHAMQLFDAHNGWAAGRRHLLRTEDAGHHWIEITPPLSDNAGIEALHFLDARQAWVVFARDAESPSAAFGIARSVDGGAQWTSSALDQPLIRGSSAIAIDFVDAQNGWLMLRAPSGSNFRHGYLLRSADGGATWTALPQPPTADRINFVSSKDGWLAGGVRGDELYATRDGGISWQRQQVTSATATTETERVYQLPNFRDADHGSLVVIEGRVGLAQVLLYETADGGRQWRLAQVLPYTGDPDSHNWQVATIETEMVMVAPPKLREFTRLSAGAMQRDAELAGKLPAGAAITALDFADATHGWLRVDFGVCAEFKARCRQETRIYSTEDGARSVLDVTPRVAASPDDGAAPDSVFISHNKRGFDKCAAGSILQMQAWWTDTPWSDANIYIGGSNRACTQSNLTPAWISAIFAQGWHLIPTWVGPQAPGSVCGSCGLMSSTPATARTQGIQQADLAMAAARALDLQEPTIIYYDMEGYWPDSVPAVAAFIDGWTARLHELGSLSGVYGAGRNASADWAPIANPPDAIWIAHWNGQATVWGLSGLSDSLWANQQRIHQYQGGHNETWGGVTFNIDSNYEDAPVAGFDSIFFSGFE